MPNKKVIKAWVDDPKRGRDWLAKECGVSVKTVTNWLSSSIDIPAKALLIIEGLMRLDEKKLRKLDLSHIVLKISPKEFDAWSRVALSEGQIVTDWIVSLVRQAYQSEQTGLPAKPDPVESENQSDSE